MIHAHDAASCTDRFSSAHSLTLQQEWQNHRAACNTKEARIFVPRYFDVQSIELIESKIPAHSLWRLRIRHCCCTSYRHGATQLADAIDLHPEISVKVSSQFIEPDDQEKGPRQRVSPQLATKPLHHSVDSSIS